MRLIALAGFLLALPAASEYAEVHGLKMYYEVHGEGRPIVLLHGGMGDTHLSFAAQIPVFAQHHRVIAIEQIGHGHTADVAGHDVSYETMTEDTAALLVQQGIRNADLVGFSDGGQIALRLAFTHPELVRRVVASGVGLGAMSPAEQKSMQSLSVSIFPKEVQEEYARVSPDGAEHWPIIWTRVRAMWAKPGWGLALPELATIKAPTLLVFGDHDFTGVEEAGRIFHAIPGAELCILPGTRHSTFSERPEWLNPIVLDFLDRN